MIIIIITGIIIIIIKVNSTHVARDKTSSQASNLGELATHCLREGGDSGHKLNVAKCFHKLSWSLIRGDASRRATRESTNQPFLSNPPSNKSKDAQPSKKMHNNCSLLGHTITIIIIIYENSIQELTPLQPQMVIRGGSIPPHHCLPPLHCFHPLHSYIRVRFFQILHLSIEIELLYALIKQRNHMTTHSNFRRQAVENLIFSFMHFTDFQLEVLKLSRTRGLLWEREVFWPKRQNGAI